MQSYPWLQKASLGYIKTPSHILTQGTVYLVVIELSKIKGDSNDPPTHYTLVQSASPSGAKYK